MTQPCPDCGISMFTGQELGGGFFYVQKFIFPQTQSCSKCGKTVQRSGWFERHH